MENSTWIKRSYTKKPPADAEIISSEIVLMVKMDSVRETASHKARLVVVEILQNNESDYASLFANVSCIELVQLILSVAAAKGFSVLRYIEMY